MPNLPSGKAAVAADASTGVIAPGVKIPASQVTGLQAVPPPPAGSTGQLVWNNTTKAWEAAPTGGGGTGITTADVTALDSYLN